MTGQQLGASDSSEHDTGEIERLAFYSTIPHEQEARNYTILYYTILYYTILYYTIL